MLHQPLGLITPDTTLQAAGGCHWVQLAQRAVPFGAPRYATERCATFAEAAVGPIMAAASTIPLPATAAFSRPRRERSEGPEVMRTLLSKIDEVTATAHR